MSTWKKVTLVNVGCVVGIGVSLLLVPPNTRLWVWATLSLVVLAGFNFFLLRHLKTNTGERRAGPHIVMWLGVVALMIDLVARYWRR
jgi:protein-S-isoprenylcysteine O-methyltransferase Ste14